MKSGLMLVVVLNGFFIANGMRTGDNSLDPLQSNSLPICSLARYNDDDSYKDFRTVDPSLMRELIDAAPQDIKDIIEALKTNDDVALEDIPKVMVFYGPTGVGKSKLAECLPLAVNAPYKFIKCSLLENECENSGVQNLRRIVEPLLHTDHLNFLIFDEIGAIATNANMTTAFWQLMDDVYRLNNSKIWVIGTTITLDNIPDAFKRRLVDAMIKIPEPNVQRRKKIIAYHVNQDNEFCTTEDNINTLAAMTNHYSGRDLEKVIERAKMMAVFRCTSESATENKVISLEWPLLKSAFDDHKSIMKDLGYFKSTWKDKTKNVLYATVPYMPAILGLVVSIGVYKQQNAIQRQFAVNQRDLPSSKEIIISPRDLFKQQIVTVDYLMNASSNPNLRSKCTIL